MMEYTEEVETVLPEGFTFSSPKKELKKEPKKKKASFVQAALSSSSSTTTEKTANTSRKGSFLSRKASPLRERSARGISRSKQGISKKFSKLRVSLEKAKDAATESTSEHKSATPKMHSPKLKKKIFNPSSKSSASEKQTTTSTDKIVVKKDDPEEAPTTSQPPREPSPTPTAECSMTDESAQSQATKSVEDCGADDESTIFDTTSIYGRITGVKKSQNKSITEEVKKEETVAPVETDTASIYDMITGVLSPSKSNIGPSKSTVGEEKVEEVPSPLESLLNATSSFVRVQSGFSVKTELNESVPPTKEHTNGVAFEQDEIAEAASVEIVQEEDNTELAKVEDDAAAGLTWAKNIKLKVGGFETSFHIADPVATITGKVNEVMGGFDTELVKQAKELEYPEAEVDYEENPTKLFLLLQQKAWGLAMVQLEKHPEEAEVWVYRKYVSEKAPNVHDASDPEKSQALVKQETALSTVVNVPLKYRWRLLPLHASIVLGAPQELTAKILSTYPEAARKVDERGSLPVHLAASRLDVDDEGEKIVLQLFGVYADSIDITDRNGRTAPELAKLARARKAAEKQRLMETASRGTRLSRACVETSASVNGREEEEEEDDGDDDSSIKSSFSTRFRNMMKGSKSLDGDEKKKSKGDDLETAKSFGDEDSIVADGEGMAPGFSFLEAAKLTDEREAQTIAEEVSKVESDEDKKSIAAEYKTPGDSLNDVPADALQLPLPASTSFGDGSVKSAKSSKSAKSKSSKSSTSSDPSKSEQQETVSVVSMDEATVVSTAVESIVASTDPQAALRAVLEKACENAGRPGMDVTKFLVVLEEEWVTDVEAIRRLDGATLDSILPIMLSRELQRLVNHSNAVDGEYLRRSRGRSKNKQSSKVAKKKKKKRSARKKPAQRFALDPINEEDHNSTPIIEEDEDESTYSAAATEVEKINDVSDEMRKNQADLLTEARQRFPTRAALEDAINERQATVSLAVGSGFDVDRQTLSQAALADDEVRKLLPLRLILPTVAELKEMHTVLQKHKEDSLKVYDVTKALQIQLEMDDIEKQIEEEEKYLAKKSSSQPTV